MWQAASSAVDASSTPLGLVLVFGGVVVTGLSGVIVAYLTNRRNNGGSHTTPALPTAPGVQDNDRVDQIDRDVAVLKDWRDRKVDPQLARHEDKLDWVDDTLRDVQRPNHD